MQVWGFAGHKVNENDSIADVSFDEPVGVDFDGDVLFTSCFGGEHSGCINYLSGISFAASHMKHA